MGGWVTAGKRRGNGSYDWSIFYETIIFLMQEKVKKKSHGMRCKFLINIFFKYKKVSLLMDFAIFV